MSSGPADVVRRAMECFSRGDFDGMVELAQPDIEIYLPENPEQQLWRGHEEAVAAVSEWTGSFDDFEIQFDEIVEAGDRVFAALTQRGRSKLAGGRIEGRVAYVITVRDGRVSRWEIYSDAADARAAMERF